MGIDAPGGGRERVLLPLLATNEHLWITVSDGQWPIYGHHRPHRRAASAAAASL